MVLWIIAGIILVVFIVLGWVSQAGPGSPGSGGPVFRSKKKESLITYEIRKNVLNKVPARHIPIGAIDEHFDIKSGSTLMLKQLLYDLVEAGYRLGDYNWSADLSEGRCVMFYLYGIDAPRTNREFESIGTVFMCKGDEDFKFYSMPSTKRDERSMPGLCISNKNLRISVHSNIPEGSVLPDWLSLCKNTLMNEL